MGKQLNVENSVISAKDDALFYNAMIQKNGVWQYGNKLDYEIISANQINIKDGMVTAQGRNYVIYPNEVDSLTIENGTVNTKRNDLIVYEVSKTSEGEQVGLKVIKGTNATTPTDPTLTQDDTLASGSKYQMPLYRVRLNGINIEGVDDLREYIVSFGNLVNDNLLLNSDFRNPINQRGQTSYSGKNIYTIDRWRMYNGTLDVLDGYIKFTNNGDDYTTLTQVLENTLPENDYVLSFKIKSVTGTIEVYANINNAGVLVGTISENTSEFVFNFNSTTLNMIWISLPIGASIELEYIKLEQGSIATPFVPRHYGEELALCQRYYQIVNVNNTANIMMPAVQITNTVMHGIVPIPVPLRTAPSIELDGHYLFDSNGAWKPIRECSFAAMSTSTVSISLTTSESITMGDARALLIQGTVSGCIKLDAEIY